MLLLGCNFGHKFVLFLAMSRRLRELCIGLDCDWSRHRRVHSGCSRFVLLLGHRPLLSHTQVSHASRHSCTVQCSALRSRTRAAHERRQITRLGLGGRLACAVFGRSGHRLSMLREPLLPEFLPKEEVHRGRAITHLTGEFMLHCFCLILGVLCEEGKNLFMLCLPCLCRKIFAWDIYFIHLQIPTVLANISNSVSFRWIHLKNLPDEVFHLC